MIWFVPMRISRSYGPSSLTGMRHAELRQLMERHLAKERLLEPLKVLDVGCGDGKLLRSLMAPQRELHGCDWIETAPAGVPAEYKQVDLNRAGLSAYADASFDLILCSDVIEHLESPGALLREISRVLRSNGMAFISFPNSWNLLERLRFLVTAKLRRFKSERVSGPWGHISFFTSEVLESLCDRARLDIWHLHGGGDEGHMVVAGRFARIPPTLLLSYNAYAVLAPRKD